MTCFSPIEAWRKPGGGVVFSKIEGCSVRPVKLSCGQCVGCRLERSRQWAVRCVHEAQLHDTNSFITLTYDNEHLPKDWSLDVRHWQLFAKRLRKSHGRFRFLHCGEYGEENGRPHLHAVLFGIDFEDKKPLGRNGKRDVFVSERLSEIWGKGFASCGDVTFESCAYVARYVLKKVTGEAAAEHYTRTDRVTGESWSIKPEYVTMSRRPGLGAEWFSRFKSDVYPGDFVVHGGKKFRPPSFYDKKLPEGELEVLKEKRRLRAANHRKDLTPERLAVREKVAEAKCEFFSKRSV